MMLYGARWLEKAMAVPTPIRVRLIALAESRRTRRVEFTAAAPSKWQPRQVTDPRSGQAFTDEGAWNYIVNNLADVEIQEIILEKPQGAKGYVFLLPGANNATIYIKLQLCGDHIKGRGASTNRNSVER